MSDLSFSTNIYALSAQVIILAQASVICLLVLVNLPQKTVTNTLGRVSIICIWLAVLTNIYIDLPDNLDIWLNCFAVFLITTHSIKCLVLFKSIQRHSLQPFKSYLMILLFGVLHSERWHKVGHY